MSQLKVPIIATVVCEGGSGGALAIGVCDHLQMLEFSTYSVISPEGCASILWRSADKAPEAAAAMGLTAGRLHELGIVDQVIKEPLGGAHLIMNRRRMPSARRWSSNSMSSRLLRLRHWWSVATTG